MATFWVTDPSINFSEMIERHRATELAPQFYYVIIYLLHKIFVYDPSVGRYFSSFIGILFGQTPTSNPNPKSPSFETHNPTVNPNPKHIY